MSLRRRFWNWIVVTMIRSVAARQAHRPPVDEALALEPMGARFPGLGDAPAWLATAIPAEDRPGLWPRLRLRAVLAIKSVWPLADGLRRPLAGHPWRPVHDAVARRPDPPTALLSDDPLAALAQDSPFSFVVAREPDGSYTLDLRAVAALTPSPGFKAGGGQATFRWRGDALRTEQITVDGRALGPSDPGWPDAVRQLLVGWNTHVTLIEHLARVHVLAAGVLSLATRRALPAAHPARALLQPFIVETERVNNTLIDGLIREQASNVPQYAGLPIAEVHRALRGAFAGFDLPLADPRARAAAQGVEVDRLPYVAAQIRWFDHFLRLTRAWTSALDRRLPVAADPHLAAFRAELDRLLPNGLRDVHGPITTWNPENLAWVLAVGAYQASVHHHQVADLTMPFMLAFDHMPPALRADGQPDEGACAEKLNSVLVATLVRYYLLDASVPHADPELAAIWQAFQDALRDEEAAAADAPPWAIRASRVPSSTHA